MRSLLLVFVLTVMVLACKKEDTETYYADYAWYVNFKFDKDTVGFRVIGDPANESMKYLNKAGLKYMFGSFSGKETTTFIVYGDSVTASAKYYLNDNLMYEQKVFVNDSAVITQEIGE